MSIERQMYLFSRACFQALAFYGSAASLSSNPRPMLPYQQYTVLQRNPDISHTTLAQPRTRAERPDPEALLAGLAGELCPLRQVHPPPRLVVQLCDQLQHTMRRSLSSAASGC